MPDVLEDGLSKDIFSDMVVLSTQKHLDSVYLNSYGAH